MIQILLAVLAAAYPVLVFCLLVVFHVPVRFFSLFIIAIAFLSFLGLTAKKKSPFSGYLAPYSWAS
jgi:hypothetical protein